MTNEPTAEATSSLENVSFAALLSGSDNAVAQAVQEAPIAETKAMATLAELPPEELDAKTPATAAFSFRTLLTDAQREELKKSAPAFAEKMVQDPNAILSFGEKTLTKLNAKSQAMLEAQKDIKVPEAEDIVNSLLREMDGFEKKYKNAKMEDFTSKMKAWFKGTSYSFKAMVRESKPIAERIDMAEVKLKEMEQSLADNAARGRILHQDITETLEEVVTILAALEEILEWARNEFKTIDALYLETKAKADAEGLATVEYRGKTITLNQLREIHETYATGVTELEKTWFDWRQQFFLGYAQAPSIRNLIVVNTTMQRRCQAFRTMGLPAARRSLIMWQQATLAKEGAEMGAAVSEGVNTLLQNAYKDTADVVGQVARESQAPIVSEETVFVMIQSVKDQCDQLVAADKMGRELRQRNVRALEAGEKQIEDVYTESRRKLVENALETGATTGDPNQKGPETDILSNLGVK